MPSDHGWMTEGELATAPAVFAYRDLFQATEKFNLQGRYFKGMNLTLAGVYRGQRFLLGESLVLFN